MTPQQINEIRKNAPYSCTAYLEDCGKINYLRFHSGQWEVYFKNEVSQGWGLANQTAVYNNLDRVKYL